MTDRPERSPERTETRETPATLLRVGESPPLPTCGSTQERVRSAALSGAPEGTLVRALEQTEGRGRLGREWHSPRGLGLWMSFLLRPRVDPVRWPALNALVALSLAEAVESLAGPELEGWRGWIKWPNDLYGRHGKLAGILAESVPGGVVVGVGLNLDQEAGDFPPSLRAPASSLALEGFSPVPSPEEVLRRFNRSLTAEYRDFQNGEDEFLRRGLRLRFYLRDAFVRLGGPSTRVSGIARDVGPGGELILDTPDGLCSLQSGELEEVRRPEGERE